jgi:hypothetical protein
MVLVDADALDQVPGLLREVADIAAETGSTAVAQCVLDVCAGLASRRAEAAVAARFLSRGEMLCRQMGMRRDPADAAFVAAAIARVQAADEGALAAATAGEESFAWRDALTDARRWLDAPPPGGGRLSPN